MRGARDRARGARRVLVGVSVAGVAVAMVACGLDVIGSRVVAEVDAGPEETGASLPPVGGDATPPAEDAGVDSGCRPGTSPVPDGGYCIDQTEVTNAQYDAFLAATADGGDGGFLDGSAPVTCAPFNFARKGPSAGGAAAPVSNVDWCDALSYCAWAGKRLCSEVEWRTACTAGGTRSYPYGDAAVPTTCNLSGTVADAGAFVGCEGGYAGIFDMVGNVWEWTSVCSGVNCAARGGSYAESSASCETLDNMNARSTGPAYGIRCCSSPE